MSASSPACSKASSRSRIGIGKVGADGPVGRNGRLRVAVELEVIAIPGEIGGGDGIGHLDRGGVKGLLCGVIGLLRLGAVDHLKVSKGAVAAGKELELVHGWRAAVVPHRD